MMNYTALRKQIIEGKQSVESIVRVFLDNIKAADHLNAYLEVYTAEALEKARSLDKKISAHPSSIGQLAGMVISLKDVICHKDHGVTAGSRILTGFKSLFTATAIQKLIDEDVIIIGRVNCDEFAMGSSNENSYYGPTRNGDDPERVPGGSSGASAVSVQMDTCHVAIGSDTGGSVRQPATFCGVTGFKPSYGRISRYGLLAYGSSFDQMGLISKDVKAISLVLSIMAGADPMDATSSLEPVADYTKALPSTRKKIAFIKETIDHPSLSQDNKDLFYRHLDELRNKGHEVDEVHFDLLDYMVPAYYILTTAEASSNLSRYDGVRYGYRSADADNIHDLYRKSRGEGFGLEVKRRIMLGSFVLSEGYFDAYYTKAQKARRMIQDRISKIMETFDFLIMPCTTDEPWKIGEMDKDPVAMYLTDIYTVLANLCGIPAISIPYGPYNDTGKNYGVQYMAPYMDEHALLSFAGEIL